VRDLPGGEDFRQAMNALETSAAQVHALGDFLGRLALSHPRWPAGFEVTPPALVDGQPLLPDLPPSLPTGLPPAANEARLRQLA
jgi:hypothetical protein